MAPRSGLPEAESALHARRRTQRGAATLGDDVDAALLAALAGLPSGAQQDAYEAGTRLGRDVYARRFYEDTLPGGVVVLSAALIASGAGSLELAHAFHRTARIRFTPTHALARAHPEVLRSYVAGTLEGFFGAAFNCAAHATPDADGFHLELGEGRDVNRKEAPA